VTNVAYYSKLLVQVTLRHTLRPMGISKRPGFKRRDHHSVVRLSTRGLALLMRRIQRQGQKQCVEEQLHQDLTEGDEELDFLEQTNSRLEEPDFSEQANSTILSSSSPESDDSDNESKRFDLSGDHDGEYSELLRVSVQI